MVKMAVLVALAGIVSCAGCRRNSLSVQPPGKLSVKEDAFRALIDTARTYRASNHIDEAVRAFRAATAIDIEGSDDYQVFWARSEAQEFLMDHAMEKGDWAEGLWWSQTWEPSGWCGTCVGWDQGRRRECIFTCQAHLLRADEAIKTMAGFSYDEPELVMLLVDIFRENGRLGQLVVKFNRAVASGDENGNAKTGLEYVKILGLSGRKDIEGLWREMDFAGEKLFGDDWPREKLSELIASMGASAKPFVVSKLASKDDQEYFQALFTLSRMKAPEVLPMMKEKIPATVEKYDLQRCFEALALLGTDQAYDLMEHYAAQGTDAQKEMVDIELRRRPRPEKSEEPKK
jgi:hypothetical protein